MSEQPEQVNKQKGKFLPVFGIAIGCALVLSLVYTLIIPGLTLENWSNSLCFSAFIVGAGGAVPVFFDAGRGVVMASKFSTKNDERQKVMDRERQKRESGMKITFALAAATVMIGIISAILSLI